jgi:hypothetical protein
MNSSDQDKPARGPTAVRDRLSWVRQHHQPRSLTRHLLSLRRHARHLVIRHLAAKEDSAK